MNYFLQYFTFYLVWGLTTRLQKYVGRWFWTKEVLRGASLHSSTSLIQCSVCVVLERANRQWWSKTGDVVQVLWGGQRCCHFGGQRGANVVARGPKTRRSFGGRGTERCRSFGGRGTERCRSFGGRGTERCFSFGGGRGVRGGGAPPPLNWVFAVCNLTIFMFLCRRPIAWAFNGDKELQLAILRLTKNDSAENVITFNWLV